MRPEKKTMVDEIRRNAGDGSFVFLADYQGMNVTQTSELRHRLREGRAKYSVVKNRLFRQVLADMKWTGLDASLKGPTAMIVGEGDVVETAKILKTFISQNQKPVIKVGMVSGEMISADQVNELASLPSRNELLGRFVGTVAAPLSQFVGVLSQKLASLVYVLKAVQEKKEKA